MRHGNENMDINDFYQDYQLYTMKLKKEILLAEDSMKQKESNIKDEASDEESNKMDASAF